MASHRRGPWTSMEDNYLMSLVDIHGAHNWVRIAQSLGSRTPKQCRERFHQNLKPTLNHEPITPEEGALIERYVREFGKRWAEIARRLPGRSDNAVKNWWNGSQNRRKRMDKRKSVQANAGIPPLPLHDDYYQNVHSFHQPTAAAAHHSYPQGQHPLPQVSAYAQPPYQSYQVQGPLPPPPGSGHSFNYPMPPPSPHPSQPRSSYVEPPLPSPATSDQNEARSSSNYGPSPTLRHILPGDRRPTLTEHVGAGSLPPIPGMAGQHRSPPQPVVSDLRKQMQLAPLSAGQQLPTAPSSPSFQIESSGPSPSTSAAYTTSPLGRQPAYAPDDQRDQAGYPPAPVPAAGSLQRSPLTHYTIAAPPGEYRHAVHLPQPHDQRQSYGISASQAQRPSTGYRAHDDATTAADAGPGQQWINERKDKRMSLQGMLV